MLSKESLLFFFDGLLLKRLQLGSLPSFLVLGFSLLSIHFEFILPKLFDISLVLLLPHSSLLSIHLFQPLVLGELLSHLYLELLLHLSFFFQTHSLELKLIILGSLKFFLHSLLSGCSFSFGCTESLFSFLDLQVVSQVLDILLFFSSLLLFQCQLIENCFSLSFCFHFHCLEIISSLLLLGSVLADQLFLILLKLLLALEQCFLLVDREDHILLALLLFHFVYSNHLVILLDHLVNDGIDILSFFLILEQSILPKHFPIDHLLLDVFL